MKKKNCIITGGTSGLGLALAKKFIYNNFFIHIIARDSKKIQELTDKQISELEKRLKQKETEIMTV